MEQDELLRRVVEVLEEQEITYLLVGSLASGVYGEPRLTHDIDVVVELRPDQVADSAGPFLRRITTSASRPLARRSPAAASST